MLAPKMFGVCLRYAKDNADAEDNLQEGFIRVFSHIGKFRHEGSLEGWVRRIMVNVSYEKLRKEQLMYPVEDVQQFEKPGFDDDIIGKITASELLELIKELPPRYKMVFNMYVLDGLNHKEISEKMGISVGTSKSNLARARIFLKQRLAIVYGEKSSMDKQTKNQYFLNKHNGKHKLDG
ncbi:MAG: RNA polymerase subunit sigma-70 [Draconibacterium sp.]|nr:MAG: RNA polymerase subunit sigma-70 [Draconibacterium sp.]